MTIERRYWDSACFIAVMNGEPGRVETCASVLRSAAMRRLEIVTCAFTITEVLYPKGGNPLSRELRDRVKRFFRSPGIVLVNVDRMLAEAAQEYYWDHNVRPKDAIHIASAVLAGVPVFETYDSGLIRFSGQVGGDPELRIREPEAVPGAASRSRGPQTELLGGEETATGRDPDAG